MMCNLKKRLIHAAVWVPLQVMFMNEWKQMAQWLKSQERLPTIKKKFGETFSETTIFIHEESIKVSLKVLSL